MTPRVRKRAGRDPDLTSKRLLDAAEREFNTHGFDGTDSNRIARAAGFAPQTFYRHFDDKTAIFLAVYERWWKGEMAALAKAARGGPYRGAAAARVALAFHARWRGFRRALRHLAIVDPRVRASRAAARRAQIAHLTGLSGRKGRERAELVAALLTAERLCDAAAEGELADLGLSPRTSKALVVRAMAVLVGQAREYGPRRPRNSDRGPLVSA